MSEPTHWKLHPTIANVEVSDTGIVRSLDHRDTRGWRIRGRVRKAGIDSDGYLSVDVAGHQRRVHQLVLETFVGPRPDGMEALHRDANRANPALSNLFYGTRSANQLQRVADGNHHLANKTRCPRGHRLVAPNLRALGIKHGKRQCLACHHGLQWVRRHPGTDPQAACDRFYSLD